MPLALHAIDYGVILLVLGCLGLITAFFASGSSEGGENFFSPRKSVGWLPAALSLTSALVGSGRLAELAGVSYDYGWKCLAAVGGLFLATLLTWWLAHPLLARLESGSLFEYIELRFDRRLRGIAAGLALVSLVVGMVSLLATAAAWLEILGLGVPPAVTITLIAMLGVRIASRGGLLAVIWSDVVLLAIVVAGGVAFALGILPQVNGGAPAIWQASIDFDRRAIVDLNWNPAETWNIWLALPAWTIAWCAWLFTRPEIQQRWIAAGDASAARHSLLAEGLLGCGLLAGILYLGIGLLAFYQQDPNRLRPIWGANIFVETERSYSRPETRHAPLVDPRSGQPRVDSLTGQPLLDPTDGTPLLDFYADDLTPATLPEIVAERRLLQPNSQEPFASTDLLLDSNGERIQTNALIVRRGATRERKRPEIVLHRSARPQLAPYFAAEHLPWGVRGLVTAGLIGGLVSAFAAGLNGLALVLEIDFYRTFGIGRSLVAWWEKKPEGELQPGDELPMLRWIQFGLTLLIVAAAILLGRSDGLLSVVASLAGLVGGPLFAVFLLGLLLRHATSLGVLVGLVVGLIVSFGWMLGPHFSPLWPFGPWSDAAGVIGGTIATLLVGGLISFFLGDARETRELRGLVVALEQTDLHLPEKLPTAPTSAPIRPKIIPPSPPRDAD